jgi:chromosome segregation ATPase
MAADGTQYLIELAAKFSGGDAAVTTLATLGDRMLKAGASAVELEKASEETASALESAAEAAKAASDALAAGETKYKSIETSADRAAKAVEKLALASEKEGEKLKAALAAGDPAKVSRLEGRIKALGDRQGEAAAKAAAAASAMKAEAVVLDAIKSKAEAAAQKHEALKKGLANVKTSRKRQRARAR